jgi:hypothetical protein
LREKGPSKWEVLKQASDWPVPSTFLSLTLYYPSTYNLCYFSPEDEDMFLRNVGICLQKYTAPKLKTTPASLLMIVCIREIKIKPFENIRNAVKEKRRRFRECHTENVPCET